jgi:hypothetical protein
LKPLLVLFQFRDIPQFIESIKDLEIDKLWVKYYSQKEAYSIARDEFLKRTEYTHFLLLTDDVIVQQKDIDQLINNTGYEVISGWFNQNLTDHADDTNFSVNSLPPNPPFISTYEGYHFIPISSIKGWEGIIPVLHQGTALTLISRKIVEQVPFRHSLGCCIDSCLSLDLAAKGIKQYVDLRVRTLHLKINDDMQSRISEVGKHEPTIEYCPN